MELPYPVIVVPGITASNLQDEYYIDPEVVWSVLSKNYERIALHPNDLRYEAVEPARVKSGKLFEIVYNELIDELRYNLKEKEDQPVPVYPFAYDWRMPLEIIEKQLDDFIEEVIERTRLLKHYHSQDYDLYRKVNLVGHSMGGLVITGYLANKGNIAPINKVVTLATPFQGSFEAVIKIVTGTANLGVTPPSSREREAARITPGLYHLLPSFHNGLTTDPGLPDSLFNPDIWQEGVYKSLEEFIRLKGLPTETGEQDARNLLNAMLKQAEQHRSKIDNFILANASLDNKKWLAVVGIGAETRVKLKIVKDGDYPNFKLSSDDRRNDWDAEKNPGSRMTGDGTVPFEGAIPKFLNLQNLVCVTPDDFGYWEIQDRALTKMSGFHGMIPNMNMLHRLIVRFFKDQDDPRGNTWGRPAPGITDTEWDAPLNLRNKNK
jgi:pimeloyl-ACP methyl ester carboxylesterase